MANFVSEIDRQAILANPRSLCREFLERLDPYDIELHDLDTAASLGETLSKLSVVLLGWMHYMDRDVDRKAPDGFHYPIGHAILHAGGYLSTLEEALSGETERATLATNNDLGFEWVKEKMTEALTTVIDGHEIFEEILQVENGNSAT